MITWRWLTKRGVLHIHLEQMLRFGGPVGLRDEGLLESALDRARNRAGYAEATVYELAAAYAFGLARNHPFLDGNKRVALIAAATFLRLNGYRLIAAQEDTVRIFQALAAGQLSEAELALWLRQASQPE